MKTTICGLLAVLFFVPATALAEGADACGMGGWCACPGGASAGRCIRSYRTCEEACGLVPKAGAGTSSGGIPAGGGMNSQQQMGMAIMQGMMSELFKPEDPAAAAARRQAAERERQLNEQRAAEARARIEREHKELEGELKLSESRNYAGDSELKRDGSVSVAADDSAVQLKHDADTPMLLRDDTPESGAKGHRIVDCTQTRELHERLEKGLPQQREVIARTEAQLASARDEGAAARVERSKTLEEAAVKEMKEVAFDALGSTRKVRARLEKLKLSGVLDAKKVRRMSLALEAVDKSAEGVKKLTQSAGAGAKYGVDHFDPELGTASRSLTEELGAANKLFVESGIAEELGEGLSKGALGPMGGVLFRAAKTTIDVSAQTWQSHISDKEAREATANLQTMREQVSRVDSRVKELEQDLSESCAH